MPKDGLTDRERELMLAFIRSVEDLLREGETAVAAVADHVGEYGTDSDEGAVVDGVVVECLRVIVDNVGLVGKV